MSTDNFLPLKGHCACERVAYEILASFLCVNCCHCTWCQRETGAAFALNAIIETSHFRITSETKPICIDIPSASGDGQMMARCPNCNVILYGDYGGEHGEWTVFVRVGTLDSGSKKTIRPDVHIFTSTKLDWIDLTSEKERGIPIMEQSYRRINVWRKDALDRYKLLMQSIDKAKQAELENAQKE